MGYYTIMLREYARSMEFFNGQIAPVQVAPVTETASGPVLDAHNAAPAVDSVVPVAAALV